MIHPQKTDRPFLFVGFDGPIHTFSQGWRGATNIYDDPVACAIPALIDLARKYEVVVFSERMHWNGGRIEVWEWLRCRVAREVGYDASVAVMAHIHLMATPLRSDDQQRGDRQASDDFDAVVDDLQWAMLREKILPDEHPSTASLMGTNGWMMPPPPPPPREPGMDSQHI